MAAVSAGSGRCGKEPADAQQLRDAQSASDFQTLHGFLHGGGIGERDPPFADDPAESSGGLLLINIDLICIGHRFQAAAELLPPERSRLFLEAGGYFVKFKFCKCFLIHMIPLIFWFCM